MGDTGVGDRRHRNQIAPNFSVQRFETAMIHTEKVTSVPWESRVCQGTGDIYEKNGDGIPFSCSLRERVSVEMGDF